MKFFFDSVLGRGILLVFGLLVILFGWAAFVEPSWLVLEAHTVALPRLPQAFDGYKIVHLSDLHLGPFNSAARIRRAVDMALAAQPDLIILTGDYVSSLAGSEADDLARELSRLQAPDGVYAVTGNHDYWSNVDVVTAALRNAGVVILGNEHTDLRRGDEVLSIAGVNDVMEHYDNLPAALNGLAQDAVVILLVHEPDFADTAARDGRVILQLSGHTHGGQVRLPGLRPFLLPALGVKYYEGMNRIADLRLHVSRGIGVTFPPLRLFAPPEVGVLTLQRETDG